MKVLEMTDNELYEIGIKILTHKLGASEVPRFTRQCKPGKGDYSADRHRLLVNQPDIDTIAKRIQDRRKAREAEKRGRVKRFAMPQSEIQKMTDIEIYEIGNQALINKLGVTGLIGFIQICQEINGDYTRGLIKSTEEAKEYIKLYTASLTCNPRIVEDYIRRGNAYSYIGEYDKAITDFDQAIKLKPHYAKAYCSRGNAYRDEVDFDKAIKDYTKAIELDAGYASAYINRGIAYGKKGKHVFAIKNYNKAIELNPDDYYAFYNRGITYSEKSKHNKAIEDFDMAIELKPNFSEAYASRALSNFKIGKTDIAIEDFDQSIKLNPEFGWAYCKRGEVWLQLCDWRKARKDLTLARNYGVDIIASFHYEFESISYFEQIFDTCLPSDIKAMLTRR